MSSKNTTEHITISDDVEVEVDCEWEYERNPGDKERAHYHGEDDGWVLLSWNVTNGVKLTLAQEAEVHEELARRGPNK
jgi:hypothetical protein